MSSKYAARLPILFLTFCPLMALIESPRSLQTFPSMGYLLVKLIRAHAAYPQNKRGR